MSHFSTLVILDGLDVDETATHPLVNVRQQVDELVEKLLSPYDEDRREAPYDDECYCVESQLRWAVRAELEAADFDMKVIRERFGTDPTVLKLRVELEAADKHGPWPAEVELDRLWNAAVAPYLEAEREAMERLSPTAKLPKPDCEECHGVGTVKSTYNKLAKFDWHQVGGRWTGDLVKDYRPENDSSNWEICDTCNGSGRREDSIGQQARALDEKYTCNGCDGNGRRMKWPTQWASFAGDIMPVARVREDFTPFAIVTPDGIWHESAKMGWWGITTDEVNDWPIKAKALIEQYRVKPDAVAVLLDCHI